MSIGLKPVFRSTLMLSIIGMALASPPAVNSDGATAPASSRLPVDLPVKVTLTAEQIKDRDIHVGAAPPGKAETSIRAPATAQFDPNRVTRIGPRLAAKVVKATRDLGAAVNPGDRVAILDSVELGQAKARYLSIRSRLEFAGEKYKREKQLAKQKISSEEELQLARAEFEQDQAELDSAIEELRLYGLSREEIEAIQAGTEAPFSRYALTSPQAGFIEKMEITPGETLTPEMTPIEIVDPARMWVMIDAFEKDVERISPGQRVQFTPDAVPTARFSGTVDWISRALSPVTKTLTVRATVANPEGILRAGMYGTARITITDSAERAWIPVDAVQTVGGNSIVFKPVAGQPNTFVAVPVKTGEEAADRVAILAGVSPGEPIVIKGAFALMSILTAGSRQDTD